MLTKTILVGLQLAGTASALGGSSCIGLGVGWGPLLWRPPPWDPGWGAHSPSGAHPPARPPGTPGPPIHDLGPSPFPPNASGFLFLCRPPHKRYPAPPPQKLGGFLDRAQPKSAQWLESSVRGMGVGSKVSLENSIPPLRGHGFKEGIAALML